MARIVRAMLGFCALILVIWCIVTLLDLTRNPTLFNDSDPFSSQVDFSAACGFSVVLSIFMVLVFILLPERLVYFTAWGCKIVLTLFLMLFYERKYEALDAYSYFDQAVELLSVPGYGAAWVSGTDFISYFLVEIFQVIPVSYHATKVLFAAFGLVGSILFYEALVLVTKRRSLFWCAVITCFPPVLFWGSILGKDPLIFLALGLFCWLVMIILSTTNTMIYGSAVLGALVVGGATGIIRDWAPKIFLPAFALVLWLWVGRRFPIRAGIRALAGLTLAAVFFVGPGWYRFPEWMINQRDTLFYHRNTLAYGGSAEASPILLRDWEDFLAYLPYGIFSSLFRPMPFEVPSAFGFACGVTNAALLMLVTWTLVTGRLHRDRVPAFVFHVFTIGIWSIVYGFISPANLGMGARFQLQIVPFILSACAILLERGASVDDRSGS